MLRSYVAIIVLLLMVCSVALSHAQVHTVDELFFHERAQRGGELVLVLSASPRAFGFGPIDATSTEVSANYLDTLLVENPVTQQIEPGLVASWEVSEDGLEVTFHVRRGVVWSDGEPFTAADIVFNMEHIQMNPHVLGNNIARFTLGDEVVTWHEVDEYTVRAKLPQPYGAFLRVLTHTRIGPKHKLAQHIPAFNPEAEPGAINRAWSTDTDVSEIVGTGPFKLVEYVVDQKIVLERNPLHWREDSDGDPLPYVDRLIYLIIPNDQVRLAQFQAGAIDYMTISPADYPALKRAEVGGALFTVLQGAPVSPTPSPPHLAFNFDAAHAELQALFRNVRFREAMAHAVNYSRILDEVYNTLAVLPGMPVLPTNKAFYNPEIEKYRRPFNLDKAATILDELGLDKRNRDGIRLLPDGSPLEFTLTAAVDIREHNDIAVLLQNDLASIGVKVHLQLLNAKLVGDKALAGDFEAMIHAYGNQPDPQLRKAIWQPARPLYYWHLSTMTDKEQEPVFEEMTDWERRVYDLFELGEKEVDPVQRKAYYDEWQLLYAQNLPVIFIAKGMDLAVVRHDVGNVFVNDDGAIVYTPYTVFKK